MPHNFRADQQHQMPIYSNFFDRQEETTVFIWHKIRWLLAFVQGLCSMVAVTLATDTS